MKLKLLIEAQAALIKVKDIPIRNYQKRYEVYRLCRKVRDALIWASEEEQRLIKDIGGTLDGQKINFPNSETRTCFEQNRIQLSETEINVPGIPIILDEADLGDIPMDVATMIALEGIIEFSPTEQEENLK